MTRRWWVARRGAACPSCEAVWGHRARYCGACGTPLSRSPDEPVPNGLVATLARAVRARRVGTVALVLVGGAAVLGGAQALGGLQLDLDASVALPDPGELAPVVADSVESDAVGRDTGSVVGESYRDGPVCRGRPEPLSCAQWLAPTPPGWSGTIAVHPRGIVVTTADGTVAMHDRGTDDPRWRAAVGMHARVWPSVAGTVPVTVSTPASVAHNGARIAATSQVGEASVAPSRSDATIRTVFLRGDEGTEVGRVPGPVEDATAHGPWLLTVGGGNLAAHAVTGATAWRREVGDDVWLTTGGAFVVAAAGELEFVSSNTGATLWRADVPARVVDVVRAGEASVVTTGDPAPGVLVFDRHGTRTAWIALPAPARWLVASDGGLVTTLVEGDDGAWIHVVDVDVALAADGAEIVVEGAAARTRHGDTAPGGIGGDVLVATTHLGADVADTLAPTAADGVVAVAHTVPTPALTLVDLETGEVRVRRGLGRPAVDVAIPRPDAVVVTDERGAWSWSTASGFLRWQVALGDDPVVVSRRPFVVAAAAGVFTLDSAPGATVDSAGERKWAHGVGGTWPPAPRGDRR